MKNLKKLTFFLFILIKAALSFSQENLVPHSFPGLAINSQNDNSINQSHYSPNYIYIGDENEETFINPNGGQVVNLKAGKEINVSSNSHIKSNGHGNFHAYIEKSNIETVWYNPNSTPGWIGKHNRLELGFSLPSSITDQINLFIANGNGGINPFDPEQIDFRVKLTSPTGRQIDRFAYYYQPYKALLVTSSDPNQVQNSWVPDTTSFPWRFRFAPDEIGLWKADLEIIIPGSPILTEIGLTFACMYSNHKGYLRVSNTGSDKDRWMYYSETNEPFFSRGINIPFGGYYSSLPSENLQHLKGIQDLINAGGNFTRIELGGQNALPDWNNYKNYSPKMDEMYGFDKVLTLCESNNIYFTLFRHHVELLLRDDWDVVKWMNNPYKLGFNISPEEYFTNANVIKWQKNTLRYIYARWGYSPNMAFYSYSEADNWTKLLENDVTQEGGNPDGGSLEFQQCVDIFTPWIQNQQNYIKQNYGNAMFCHTTAGEPVAEYVGLSDIVGLHSYGQIKNINFINRYKAIDKAWNDFRKPVLLEEIGPSVGTMYCCTGIEYHNAVWASSLSGCMGTGMDYWWDRGIMDFGYHLDLIPLKQFFEGENLRDGKYIPQKWDDFSIHSEESAPRAKERKVENFALKHENKERVLGWVHNATLYWRNMWDVNSCIANLTTDSWNLNPPCHVAEDPYKNPPYHDQYASAIYSDFMTDFDNEIYKDDFTDTYGQYTATWFELKGLKGSGLIKKHWYKVTYYRTNESNLQIEAVEQDEFHTNAFGTLKLDCPPMLGLNPDFAYKVEYLGHYKNLDIEDTIPNQNQEWNTQNLKKAEINVIIYPNPNSGQFIIKSNVLFTDVIIYNNKGEIIYNFNGLNSLEYEIFSHLEAGTYLVQVKTFDEQFHNEKIVVL